MFTCNVYVNYAADTCRVMRELEAVKQEALMLQEQMKTIKYDIQKVLCVVCFFLILRKMA